MTRREATTAKRTDNPNLAVYNAPEVTEHYAALNYLSECEKKLFDTYIRPGADILDLGVGGGRTTSYLKAMVRHYVGVDYAPEMIEICRAKYPSVDFRTADASDLSIFPDGSFDAVVFSFNGIDYIVPDAGRQRCLQGCHRVLRKGGTLLFSSHNPRAIFVRPLWNQQRVRAFAEKLVGRESFLLTPLTMVATGAKATLTVMRASVASIRRVVTRVPRKMFWKGKGWMWEPSHGGLTLHYAIPSHVINEVEGHGFSLLQVLGDDYPRPSRQYITDWYYYVFAKKADGESAESCE
jgi:ubiquinone/menaquinone biosynthesis C-methylase UbiE